MNNKASKTKSCHVFLSSPSAEDSHTQKEILTHYPEIHFEPPLRWDTIKLCAGGSLAESSCVVPRLAAITQQNHDRTVRTGKQTTVLRWPSLFLISSLQAFPRSTLWCGTNGEGF